MKNTWLGLLIVLSIALQSFVAVANSNENHQVDAQHIQVEHSHDVDNAEPLNDLSENDHNINDCHHCGHCQGSHAQWSISKTSPLMTCKLLITNQYFYSAHLDKSFIEELTRPPIA